MVNVDYYIVSSRLISTYFILSGLSFTTPILTNQCRVKVIKAFHVQPLLL